jgi:hypothetical protein
MEPLGFLVVIEFRRLMCGQRHLAQDKTETLEVQVVNPVFYGQLPLLFGIAPAPNEGSRTETEPLVHRNVVPVEPAKLFRFRPIVPLRPLARPVS